ncbi:MAG: phosphoribosylamine--glycine ligase [Rhodocyclaceae bacterium]
MNALIIGSGGREHAMAWKLAKSETIGKVFVAPGNAGTHLEYHTENIDIKETEIQKLADFAADKNNRIKFTIVGPEAPLAAGIVDEFRSRGLHIFGPTKAAARLESSKEFAKKFMQKYNIPTAKFQTFDNSDPANIQAAHDYIDQNGTPIVIKADGLAAGKGVVVATTLEEAHQAVDDMLNNASFGAAGAKVVIEEFLDGEEASFIVMCDGKNVLPLASSQDHKRVGDNDTGANTGGMGAYSPAPIITPKIHAEVMRDVIYPTIRGMLDEGIPFTGFLYAGLMISKNPDATNKIKVLEFNCRMGDPETQPIMMRLKTNFADLIEHAIDGTLNQIDTEWDRRVALGVVLAAQNYPQTPKKGDVITFLTKNNINISNAEKEEIKENNSYVFHAGTAINADGKIVTNGGRVLCVTALGDSTKIAQKIAYEEVGKISWDGMHFRHDIGNKALK